MKPSARIRQRLSKGQWESTALTVWIPELVQELDALYARVTRLRTIELTVWIFVMILLVIRLVIDVWKWFP